MDEPIWIDEVLVRAIHERQIAEHGGAGGVRDEGLLSSALARPRHRLAYSDAPLDLADFAASYAFAIAKNHPFFDGDKRTAAVVCETFIELNGELLNAPDEDMYLTFLSLAEGTFSEEQLAEWIREHQRKS